MMDFNRAVEVIVADADTQGGGEPEAVALANAAGRYLASAIESPIDVPGFDNSAMDGFAVRIADVELGKRLPISQRIPAGAIAGDLAAKTVARIFTGAMIPPGADAVILQEDALYDNDSTEVEFTELPSVAQHIRPAGQDIAKHQKALQEGKRLTPADIGLLASLGYAELPCTPNVRVAFFSSGDELVEPGQPLAPGQIYNSNRFFLSACIRELGATAIDLGRCPDSAESTREMLLEASACADLVITTGGMSVGEEDHIRHQAQAIGDIDFWKLAIKPGKPVAFGKIGDARFFGLPGNPVSSFVTFQLLVRPWLLKRLGAANWDFQRLHATATFTRKNSGRRLEFLRANVQRDTDSSLSVSLFDNQSSGVLSSVAASNVLLPIQPSSTIQTGDRCELIVLSPMGLQFIDD